jgi:hypothetical protein
VRWVIRLLAIGVLFRTAYEAGEISTLTAALMFGYGVLAAVEKLEAGVTGEAKGDEDERHG